MPIYQRKCTKCDHVIERIEKMDSPETIVEPCPMCDNSTFQKIMSSTSFRLVGGGWESDNYQKKGD
jgi:putative FmdB family regulatory protein